MNEIFKGMDNASEAINENFELLIGNTGEDYVRFSNGKVIASLEVSINRTQNIDLTQSFSIDFDEIDAIIFTPTTREYQDARDVVQLMGLRAYNHQNRIRIMRASSNIGWSGSGLLDFKLTVIGTSKGDDI